MNEVLLDLIRHQRMARMDSTLVPRAPPPLMLTLITSSSSWDLALRGGAP